MTHPKLGCNPPVGPGTQFGNQGLGDAGRGLNGVAAISPGGLGGMQRVGRKCQLQTQPMGFPCIDTLVIQSSAHPSLLLIVKKKESKANKPNDSFYVLLALLSVLNLFPQGSGD